MMLNGASFLDAKKCIIDLTVFRRNKNGSKAITTVIALRRGARAPVEIQI